MAERSRGCRTRRFRLNRVPPPVIMTCCVLLLCSSLFLPSVLGFFQFQPAVNPKAGLGGPGGHGTAAVSVTEKDILALKEKQQPVATAPENEGAENSSNNEKGMKGEDELLPNPEAHMDSRRREDRRYGEGTYTYVQEKGRINHWYVYV